MIKISPLELELQAAISESLQSLLVSNAVFLSERLYYENKTEENLSLLCRSLLMENRSYKIYSLLKKSKFPKNQYLFGIACLRLNKTEEAQSAFQQCLKSDYNSSFSFYMLGLCYEKQQNFKEASGYYMKALEKNPTLWTAYEKLCNIGSFVAPAKVFVGKKNSEFDLSKQSINFLNYRKKFKNEPQRKSTNLFDSVKNDDPIEECLNHRKTCTPIDFTNGFDLNLNLNSYPIPTAANVPQTTYKEISSFLNLFACPCHLLSKYQAKEALLLLKKLPSKHYNSGWVQLEMAKCYMELRDYFSAEEHFKITLELEPHHIETMAFYSSCLWQLKKNMELACLAHNALEQSRLESDSWVVVGNCYSLENEHENALKFFHRAIQLKPDNSYAHSLCGHEYGYLEDFVNAKKSFEISLCIDKRNYNCWWGLGCLYFKSEKYEKAIELFQKAISINPRNSILFTFLGMAFNSKRIFGEGLKNFDSAIVLDDKNHLARFQKANALFQLEQYDLALLELEKLRILIPHESSVVVMIARIYCKLGNPEKANNFINLAIDIEPHLSHKIKESTGLYDFNII